MKHTRTRFIAAVAASALLALVFVGGEREAAAQLGGYALDQFDPSPAGDPFFGVESPATPGQLTPRFGVAFDYAHEPLRVGTNGVLVSQQGFLHVGASLAVVDRLMFSVNMPVALLQGGQDQTIQGVAVAAPTGAHAGDLRMGLRLRLAGDYLDPFQIGVGARVYLPTAGNNNFDGDGAVRAMPELLVGGRGGSTVGFVYSATGGAMIRGSDNPHEITFGAGAALTLWNETLQIGPELSGSQQIGSRVPLQGDNVTVKASSKTNLEVLGGAKLRILDGLVFGAAAGPGLADGVGTPEYRFVGSIAWAPVPRREEAPADADADGIPDKDDACPNQAGKRNDDPKKNGCPVPDRDGDGIDDQLDACPDVKGRPNADPTRNGCPADYDRDGIPDDQDACPNQAGVRSADPKKNGCPGDIDTDGDGIPDKEDACPRVKGVASADPAKNGCPEPVKASASPMGTAIVHFEFGSDTIRPDQKDELERMKGEILAHPEVKRFEVRGHADEVGDAAFNQALSQRRARAVSGWLVSHGVAGSRLTPKGYGSAHPLSASSPDEAHRLNRRVEVVPAR